MYPPRSNNDKLRGNCFSWRNRNGEPRHQPRRRLRGRLPGEIGLSSPHLRATGAFPAQPEMTQVYREKHGCRALMPRAPSPSGRELPVTAPAIHHPSRVRHSRFCRGNGNLQSPRASAIFSQLRASPAVWSTVLRCARQNSAKLQWAEGEAAASLQRCAAPHHSHIRRRSFLGILSKPASDTLTARPALFSASYSVREATYTFFTPGEGRGVLRQPGGIILSGRAADTARAGQRDERGPAM